MAMQDHSFPGYPTLFRATTYSIERLRLIKQSSSHSPFLQKELGEVIDLLIAAQQYAEHLYMTDGEVIVQILLPHRNDSECGLTENE